MGFPSGFVSERDGAKPANRSAGKNSPAVAGFAPPFAGALVSSIARTDLPQMVFASAIEWKRLAFSRFVTKASGSTTKGGAATERFPTVTWAVPSGRAKVMGSPEFSERSSGYRPVWFMSSRPVVSSAMKA